MDAGPPAKEKARLMLESPSDAYTRIAALRSTLDSILADALSLRNELDTGPLAHCQPSIGMEMLREMEDLRIRAGSLQSSLDASIAETYQLRQRIQALETEIARLRAGEASDPARMTTSAGEPARELAEATARLHVLQSSFDAVMAEMWERNERIRLLEDELAALKMWEPRSRDGFYSDPAIVAELTGYMGDANEADKRVLGSAESEELRQEDVAVLERWAALPHRPKIVFIGTQKTASLLFWQAFRDHPQTVTLAKDWGIFSVNWADSPHFVEEYLKHYERFIDGMPVKGVAADPVMVEMTSDYYADPVSLRRIAECCGRDTKILFSIRNPISMAFSLYNNGLRQAGWTKSFFESIEYDKDHFFPDIPGILENIYAIFPRENVLIIDYDLESKKFPRQSLGLVFNFCGLSSYEFPLRYDNISYHPRYLYNADRPLRIESHERHYLIPPRTLVYCVGNARDRVWYDPPEIMVAAALNIQSNWTQELSTATCRSLFETHCRAMAERLQRDFGINTSHWSESFQTLRYQPAPPPEQFAIREG